MSPLLSTLDFAGLKVTAFLTIGYVAGADAILRCGSWILSQTTKKRSSLLFAEESDFLAVAFLSFM